MPNEACKEFVCAIMAVLADLTLTRERRGTGERLVAGLAAVATLLAERAIHRLHAPLARLTPG